MPKLVQTKSVSARQSAAADAVLQLIADYQRAVRATVMGLRRQAGVDDLLRGWRTGDIERSGTLQQPRGRYSFHGAGCRFEVSKRIMEVNFGPNGRCDGFDAWRLAQYAESAFEWQELNDSQIEQGLRALIRAETVVQPGWEPTPEQLYLAEDVEVARAR